MKTQIRQLKVELKQLASNLKELKPKTRKHYSFLSKKYPNSYSYEFYKTRQHESEEYKNDCAKFPRIDDKTVDYFYKEYRTKHIAYCLLRGRTMEQIEPKLRDPNSWTHTCIRRDALALVKSIMEKQDEAVGQ